MKSPYPFLLACLWWSLVCGGCVRSEQPLSAIAEAKADPRLVGQWRDAEENKGSQDKSVRVTFSEKGVGHLSFLKEDGQWKDDPNILEFFVTRTAKASYLNVLVYDRDQKDPDASKDKHFLFYRYQLSDDGQTLTYQGLKTRPFQQAVAAGTLKGQNPHGKDFTEQDDVLLQGPSDAILHFLEALPDDAYEQPVQVTRVP